MSYSRLGKFSTQPFHQRIKRSCIHTECPDIVMVFPSSNRNNPRRTPHMHIRVDFEMGQEFLELSPEDFVFSPHIDELFFQSIHSQPLSKFLSKLFTKTLNHSVHFP